MLFLLFFFSVILIISFFMIFMSYFLSKKTFQDREKGSPFECGFDSKLMSRLPFSLRFFLVTIIFLIFDVEIVLIFPLIQSLNFSNLYVWFYSMIIFMFILIFGLYYELYNGALNWND